MDIRKIESVCAVADYCSYSEAADCIATSPSVISKHVVAAEEELGIRIFERATKSHALKPTPEGERVLLRFREILRQYDLILNEIREGKARKKSILTVGYVPRIGSFGENRILAGLQLAAPNLIISRKANTGEHLINALLDGKADAIFLPLLEGTDTADSCYAKLDDQNIAVMEIMHMSKIFMGMPATHRFADYPEIPEQELHQLRSEVFIIAANDMKHEENLSILSKKIGASSKLNVRYVDFSEQSLALELVNTGIGLLPQQCLVPERIGNVRFVPLAGSSGSRLTLYLVYRKGKVSDGVRMLCDYARTASGQIYRQYPYVAAAFPDSDD